jgi:aspartokinase/homoserine dehydrogenase 1
MRVLKFGGSSLGSAERFVQVAKIITDKSNDSAVAVVVSAPQGVTNHLVAMAENISDEIKLQNDLEHFRKAIITIIDDLGASLPKFSPLHAEQVLINWEHKLSRYLQGATMLSYCPDHIRAIIISIGERLSVALLESVLNAQSIKTSVIEPEKFLITNDASLNAVADLVLSKENFENHYNNLNAWPQWF